MTWTTENDNLTYPPPPVERPAGVFPSDLNVMAETVFIFGAGASAAAGCPLMDQFYDRASRIARETPAQSRFRQDLARVEGAIHALDGVFAKVHLDTLNLEGLFCALEMGETLGKLGSLAREEVVEAKNALLRLIAATLESSLKIPVERGQYTPGTVLGPKGYDALAEMIALRREQDRTPRSVAVVTFNYDVGLEVALLAKKMPWSYCLDDPVRIPDEIAVCKLHGSVNWTLSSDHRRVIASPPNLAEIAQQAENAQKPYGRAFFAEQLRRSAAVDGEAAPYLVPPTDSKGPHRERIKDVWVTAARELSEASSIAIVGYSLPPTDAFFRNFFGVGSLSKTPLQRIMVIDRCQATIDRFADLLSGSAKSRFRPLQMNFEDAVGRLQDLLL